MQQLLRLLMLFGVVHAARASVPELPSDVQAFVDRRNACDHWRGEEPYDEQRRLEISRNACNFCNGSDSELARLKAKYKGKAAVSSALARFESKIEPSKTSALAKACGR